MDKSYVVISDTQLPYEDARALRAVLKFIGEYQPSEVVHIGDFMDYPDPSRWSKGQREEFKSAVISDSEYGKRKLLEPLRAVYDGPVGVIEGNHDLRPRDYLKKNAPALAESDAFNFENLLDFDGFGVSKLPDFYKFQPGWIMTHGHLGNISLSQISGRTAANTAESWEKSVIMGHTHRLGISGITKGVNAQGNVYQGLEVGNLMNMKKAQYLNGATANWQQGFGMVFTDGHHVSAQPIRISAKKFIVDGQTYKL